ncbi:PBSX family phage terminase large subunit [uncultured Tissierella sp.]|uniref:PBSX family phage terminase large subunit n=1 Tax=uncultured Tissierella sp. TaxID=448160 RepID=UPI00280655A0|nr:PBSX family phage terminase large subunit [uncultured Tissierella sp.]MDU5080243.1 PBSX family phage terminase large subunit [Bacillota bacterium]
MIDWGQWGDKSLDFILTPIEEDARINILEGSVRSSKTVTMIPKWIEYIRRGPKGLLIMTGVSKDTVYDNVLNDLFDTLGSDNYKYNRNSGDLTIYWKETVKKGKEYKEVQRQRKIKIVGAKDEGSEKYLRGKTLAGAYCDELSLMPEKFFKQLLNRLSVKGAKLYGTTNPDSPFHYLYTEYITDEKKLESGMVKVWHFNLDDNPNLDDEYKEFIRSAYTGMWYARMVLGLWVMAQGIIYEMWDDKVNLFDDKDIPPGLFSNSTRHIAIDYGTGNPTVFLDIYDDGTTVWIMNEYYHDGNKDGQKEDVEYADDLNKFVGKDFPTFIILDPSALSFKVTLRNRGYMVKDADNSVNDGIRMVASMLKRRLIRVHKRCINTRKEFASYVWDEKASKRGETKPIKQNDHAMDALRYYIKTMIPNWRFAA